MTILKPVNKYVNMVDINKPALDAALEMLFFGYVGSPGLPKADDANSIMTTDVTINIASRIRYAKP